MALFDKPLTFDREDLVLSEVLIDDFSTASVDICRPMFDALFNAAGLAKWPEYEQSKGRRRIARAR